MVVTFVGMVSASRMGRLIDRHGERRSLSIINLLYVVALVGLRAVGQRVAGLLLLPHLRGHLAVLVHRRRHLPAQDRGARGRRLQPGHGRDHPARHRHRGAGGGRLHPQLRRLPGPRSSSPAGSRSSTSSSPCGSTRSSSAARRASPWTRRPWPAARKQAAAECDSQADADEREGRPAAHPVPRVSSRPPGRRSIPGGQR